ncbi:restriction endonuclease subunit S [Pseudaquabacterium rugosum]|uniref:Restriction endonuclease subunit S n=1 Tax=Pseudaquabacterium rugosum TaxID=2984194 RepID=A0ABU9B4D2_9BURK
MIDAKLLLLSQVATVQAGYPFRGAIEGAPDGDVIALQMKDVDPESGVAWAGALRAHLPGRKVPSWLQPGDLLFVAKGARFYAVVVDTPPMPAVCGPAFFHLRVQPGAAVAPAFLAWQINQPPFQRLLMQSAEGSGQLSIRRPVLEALPLAVPPLPQQHRIVALDGTARAERAMMRRLIQNREQQLHALAEALSAASMRSQQATRP